MRPHRLALLVLALLVGLAGPSATSLAQVGRPGTETRTVIRQVPITITEPGAYVLGRSFAVAYTGTAPAVRIDASNVDLDLNGESLTAIPGAEIQTGIEIGPVSDVRIHHGRLRAWTGDGVAADPAASGVTVQDLSLESCGGDGVSLAGEHHRLERVSSRDHSGAGIVVGGHCVLREIVTSNNGLVGLDLGEHSEAVGARIESNGAESARLAAHALLADAQVRDQESTGNAIDCQAGARLHRVVLELTAPDRWGVVFPSSDVPGELQDCTMIGGFVGLYSNAPLRVEGCTAAGGYAGFVVEYAPALYVDCVVRDTENVGIALDSDSVALRCTATGCDIGLALHESSAIDCDAMENNTGFDLSERSSATRCRASRNTNRGYNGSNSSSFDECVSIDCPQGFGLFRACRASHCIAQNASSRAFHASSGRCTITDCRVNSASIGIRVSDANSTVLRCSVTNSSTPYLIDAGNNVGPITTIAAAVSPVGNVHD